MESYIIKEKKNENKKEKNGIIQKPHFKSEEAEKEDGEETKNKSNK